MTRIEKTSSEFERKSPAFKEKGMEQTIGEALEQKIKTKAIAAFHENEMAFGVKLDTFLEVVKDIALYSIQGVTAPSRELESKPSQALSTPASEYGPFLYAFSFQFTENGVTTTVCGRTEKDTLIGSKADYDSLLSDVSAEANSSGGVFTSLSLLNPPVTAL